MKRHADVLIIGGGAIGLCCAHYLNRSGRHTTLVEKGDIGAIPVLRDLQQASMGLFQELAVIENLDLGLRRHGIVDTYLCRKVNPKLIVTS